MLAAEGPAGAIHAVYKTAQNIMEYGCGIAGRAAAMTAAAHAINPDCHVMVTRKHFPGTKTLSLAAALAGGAVVHRTGLSDSVLIFDQHRVFCRDVPAAIFHAKRAAPERKIAVEAGSLEEVLTFVRAGCDIVQCERFALEKLEELVKAVKSVNPAVLVSAEGGVNGENAAAYARAGADMLVTSWVYFGKPFDIKMKIEAI